MTSLARALKDLPPRSSTRLDVANEQGATRSLALNAFLNNGVVYFVVSLATLRAFLESIPITSLIVVLT